jgi:uncharacterized membrane protein
MSLYVWAFLIGLVAGLRALTAPAVVSWAARLSWLHVCGTWLAFFEAAITPYIFSALALFELVNDKLPKTPSRKEPLGFGARLITGALSGAAIGASGGSIAGGLVAGVLGAVAGTLGGSAARGWLAKAIGNDFPAALIEDAVAVGGAFWIVSQLS